MKRGEERGKEGREERGKRGKREEKHRRNGRKKEWEREEEKPRKRGRKKEWERGRETGEERGGRENDSPSSLFLFSFFLFSLSFNILFSLKRNSFLRILITQNCQKDYKKSRKMLKSKNIFLMNRCL